MATAITISNPARTICPCVRLRCRPWLLFYDIIESQEVEGGFYASVSFSRTPHIQRVTILIAPPQSTWGPSVDLFPSPLPVKLSLTTN